MKKRWYIIQAVQKKATKNRIFPKKSKIFWKKFKKLLDKFFLVWYYEQAHYENRGQPWTVVQVNAD